jgi:hypothetical protein
VVKHSLSEKKLGIVHDYMSSAVDSKYIVSTIFGVSLGQCVLQKLDVIRSSRY